MASTAYLLYRDAGAAVDWLCTAFGLEEDAVLTAYGARRYGAEDLEGHPWYFAQDPARGRKRASRR